MTFTNEDLDKIVKRFEAELADGSERNICQTYQNLKTHILANGLGGIGCLSLITRAFGLMKRYEGDEATNAFQKLSNHLVAIEDVHNKFFSILYDTNHDVLFYEELSNWEILSEPLEINFSELEIALTSARKEEKHFSCLEKFFGSFLSILEKQLDDNDFENLKNIIQLTLGGFKYCERWDVFGLFTLSDGAATYGIKINTNPGTGKNSLINSTESSIETSANRAVASVSNLFPLTKKYDYKIELEREDIKYSGNSIELPFCAAIASKIQGIEIDPYTAFTGCVEINSGRIKQVSNINRKLNAASKSGIRRVFIPDENKGEIKDTFPNLDIRPVNNIHEVFHDLENRPKLGFTRDQSDLFKAKVKRLIILLKDEKIHYLPSRDQSIPGGIQLWFTNYSDNLNVNLYNKKLSWVVGGSSSTFKENIENICKKVFGEKGSFQVDKGETVRLKVSEKNKQILVQEYFFKSDNVIIEEEKNCLYRAKIIYNGSAVYVRQFTSGTLTVFGPTDFRNDVLAKIQSILGISDTVISKTSAPNKKKQAQIEAVKSINFGSQWIGTDESGKGDYYGPLVGAAVLVDERTAVILEELGIRDSKKISDKRIHELAIKIKQLCGEKAQVIPISPEKYNDLYTQFKKEGKNLNTLLAWAHTRGIENIIKRFRVGNITVIVDKFADESFIQSKLLESGRNANLNIVQLPKAEANIAVAAASVLARSEFLKRLARLSAKYEQKFPKGASNPNILVIGKSIVQNLGKDELKKVAKLHFKTTKKII
mgnify:CR=1 FL=1